MDSLRAMFPDLDASVLQATLEAHGGSVEQAVNYLLSSHDNTNPDRQAQEEQDAALARQLQAEDTAAYDQQHDTRAMYESHHHHAPATGGGGGGPSSGFQLPSLADVQSAVQPIVNGVAYAGRVAANSVSGLYRDLVGDDAPRRNVHSVHPSEDESVVLRGEGSSPAATRSTARQRRPETSSYGHSYGDKKDD